MIKIITIVAVLALSPGVVSGQDMFISAAQLIGYGTFTSKNRGPQKRLSHDSPATDGVDNIRFVKITNEIQAKTGVQFGIEYVVNTNRRGRPLEITAVIHFPEPGMILPSGKVLKVSRQKETITIGDPAFYGYGFDESWEKVPGEWVFEIWHKKSRLVVKRFIVSLPQHESLQ